jgi:hypothetical protein
MIRAPRILLYLALKYGLSITLGRHQVQGTVGRLQFTSRQDVYEEARSLDPNLRGPTTV